MLQLRFALFLLLALTTTPITAAEKPNIVLFISDDHGLADSGCYGNSDVKTPHIDRLARQGMRFRNAFAASPTCTPARSAIFTGLYPIRNGAHANHSKIKSGVKTWPAYFKELGYRVALVGKTHVKPKEAFAFEYIPSPHVVHPQDERKWARTGVSMDGVRALLAKPGDKPLCVVIATKAPHVPWLQNKQYDPASLQLPDGWIDTPETRTALANYYTDVSHMDAKLGEVMAMLDEKKMRENTVLVYTSDQGPQFPRAKWNLYDVGIRVPLIVRWTGKIKPGSAAGAMVSHIDLLPTMLDLIAGQRPEKIDGRSFVAVLKGGRAEHRDMIYAAHTADGKMNDYPSRCLRTKADKLIVNFRSDNQFTTHVTKGAFVGDTQKLWKSWVAKASSDAEAAKIVKAHDKRPELEMYNLKADPGETHNLAKDPEEIDLVKAMRFRIKLWMRQQKDTLK